MKYEEIILTNEMIELHNELYIYVQKGFHDFIQKNCLHEEKLTMLESLYILNRCLLLTLDDINSELSEEAYELDCEDQE